MQGLLEDRRVLLPLILTVVAIAVGSVLIVALSGDASSSGDSAAAVSPATSGGETVKVEIVDFKYDPESFTVKAGARVSWTNRDTAPHTATVADGFDTGNLRKGDEKTLTLKTPGTFEYICEIHPFMKATVIVE